MSRIKRREQLPTGSWNPDGSLNTQTQIPAPEHRDMPPRVPAWKKAALGMLGVGVAAGASIAAIELTSDDATSSSPDKDRKPAAGAPITPGETLESNPLQLSVEKYQDGEALIMAHNEILNDWVMAGANQADYDKVDWTSYEESVDNIAEQYDSQYRDAIFVEGYEDRPELIAEVEDYQRVHRAALDAHYKTTDSGEPADIEPYTQQTTITDIVSIEKTEDTMVIDYRYSWSSNADKNRGDLFVENVNGYTGARTITFVAEDGVWKELKEVKSE